MEVRHKPSRPYSYNLVPVTFVLEMESAMSPKRRPITKGHGYIWKYFEEFNNPWTNKTNKYPISTNFRQASLILLKLSTVLKTSRKKYVQPVVNLLMHIEQIVNRTTSVVLLQLSLYLKFSRYNNSVVLLLLNFKIYNIFSGDVFLLFLNTTTVIK